MSCSLGLPWTANLFPLLSKTTCTVARCEPLPADFQGHPTGMFVVSQYSSARSSIIVPYICLYISSEYVCRWLSQGSPVESEISLKFKSYKQFMRFFCWFQPQVSGLCPNRSCTEWPFGPVARWRLVAPGCLCGMSCWPLPIPDVNCHGFIRVDWQGLGELGLGPWYTSNGCILMIILIPVTNNHT